MRSADKMDNEPIYVTRPTLPPLEEFEVYLKDIWERRQLTNGGKYHQMLESELCNYLGVKHCSLFCNGMIALQIGLLALRITGEVITTPFSFVATTHSIYWNSCTPVFCDIDPDNYCLDPAKLEQLITPKTTAILPVHVYGCPCNTDAIAKVADTYGLKVFYDAAHAFGVRKNGVSVLNSGDLSMLSFHATKIFNTFEGGALITDDPKLKRRIDYLKNFGFADEAVVVAPGSNGKMNELQAACGLLQLKRIDEDIARSKELALRYRKNLEGITGVKFSKDVEGIKHNYSYFPVMIDKTAFGRSRDDVYNEFKKHNIFTRRYFYPLISRFSNYKGLPSASPDNLPVAEKVAEQVICLPIYPDLSNNDCDRVSGIIRSMKTFNLA